MTRRKSYDDIKRQADRLRGANLDSWDAGRINGDEWSLRENRIDAVERRYKRNITKSAKFQASQYDFNREGMDLTYRRLNKAAGRNTFKEMYGTKHPRSTYMGNSNK